MSNRFHTVEDATGQEFYQLPKDLIKNPAYKKLSSNAIIAYCVLKDRHSVSLKNRWIDDEGRVYFLFSDSEMSQILDVSVFTVNRYKRDLKEFGLIHMERQGLNKRNRIYLLKPESAITYNKPTEPYSGTDLSKSASPDLPKSANQDLPKSATLSKKNLSNNNLSKEDDEAPLQSVIDSYLKNIAIGSKELPETIINDLKTWLGKIPVDVIKNEIEYAAKKGGKSFAYLEKALKQDEKQGIDTLLKLENKRIEYAVSKKGAGRHSQARKKPSREELKPEWYEESQKEWEERESALKAEKSTSSELEKEKAAFLARLAAKKEKMGIVGGK